MPKILFVGDLNPHSRSLQRHRAFQALGCSVSGVNAVPDGTIPGISAPPSPFERLCAKVGLPLDMAAANSEVLRLCEIERFDLLWFEKTLQIRPSTLKRARLLQPKARLAWYSEDDMFARHNQSVFFRHGLSQYDVVFTTKSVNCHTDELPKLGARRVVHVDKAFDPSVHRPRLISDIDRLAVGAVVGFIGTYEQERGDLVCFLAHSGIEVTVWGNGWRRLVGCHENLKIKNQPLYGDDYARSISATNINLCFLRRINRDQQTARSVEIPACGGFMLAERSIDHQRLFKEDAEVVMFDPDDPPDLLRKVRRYIDDGAARADIAEAGRRRCLTAGYSHRDRVKYMLGQLQ